MYYISSVIMFDVPPACTKRVLIGCLVGRMLREMARIVKPSGVVTALG